MSDPRPAFIVVSVARLALSYEKRLSAHAPTYLVSTPADAIAPVRAHARCLGVWLDGDFTAREVKTLWDAIPGLKGVPTLWTSTSRPGMDLDALGCRWLPRNAPRAEIRYFLGHALALEVSRRTLVARAVEDMARERGLTERQMELSALSTLNLDRQALADGLGVSPNTLKTRVRQLLRVHRLDTFDALGKAVLRVAVDIAERDANTDSMAPSPTPACVPGMLPAERRAAV